MEGHPLPRQQTPAALVEGPPRQSSFHQRPPVVYTEERDGH